MSKKLCKKEKVKDIKSEKAKFTCKKCGFQAKKKKSLCKPEKL
jgi:lipopolysaccharide biosynthesis regulator YciM